MRDKLFLGPLSSTTLLFHKCFGTLKRPLCSFVGFRLACSNDNIVFCTKWIYKFSRSYSKLQTIRFKKYLKKKFFFFVCVFYKAFAKRFRASEIKQISKDFRLSPGAVTDKTIYLLLTSYFKSKIAKTPLSPRHYSHTSTRARHTMRSHKTNRARRLRVVSPHTNDIWVNGSSNEFRRPAVSADPSKNYSVATTTAL